MRRTRGSTPVSRSLHRVDQATSRPTTALFVTTLILGFVVALAIAGFPETWETTFAAACAAVTTIMVFTIQHTQRREQAAIQLKLDEIIRALPEADDHLVQLESGHDEELFAIEERQLEHHLAIRGDDST